MERDVLPAQFAAGLHGLGLLRSWPFLDSDAASASLAELERMAGDRTRGSLDILDTAAGYASWSASYDERVNPLLLAEQPAMSKLLDGIDAGRALDAACGTGRLSRMLVDHGHEVTGLDASQAMLERARTNVPEAVFLYGSFLDLPFPDASFDTVCCGLALTHVQALRPVIDELARVLRVGGRMLLSDMHPFAVATGSHAFFRHPDGSRAVVRNELHWHGEYLDAFATAGLRIRGCVEPRFSDDVLEAFIGKGGSPTASSALENLLGLPYVLIWECVRETSSANEHPARPSKFTRCATGYSCRRLQNSRILGVSLPCPGRLKTRAGMGSFSGTICSPFQAWRWPIRGW
jgi:SAM-dependent methyltransferase